MNTRACEHLDGYLGGWLDPNESTVFEAHLADCSACRDAIAESRWIDNLVRNATNQLTNAPDGLVERIKRANRKLVVRRRLKWSLVSVSAAAIVLTVSMWPATNRPAAPGPPGPLAAQDTPTPTVVEATAARPLVRVTFQPRSSVIALPVETKNVNVSVFWVYPTIGERKQANSESMPRSSRVEPRSNT